jgi:two-component system chemotaxis response regulator CheB
VKAVKKHSAQGDNRYRYVAIGGSAGGFEALRVILMALPVDFALPILVAQHLHAKDEGAYAEHVARLTLLPVVEACDKEPIKRGHLYTAPANYHMLMERDGTIGLSIDEQVNCSRPSIDVLFESAALACGDTVVAVILSGASADGAKGICAIKKAGGLTIAQDPSSAETPLMPQAAIDTGAVDEVLSTEQIGRLLASLGERATL